MILFVGDKPSSQNLHPEIAFVGTRSYKTLLDWIYKMNVSISDVTLINSTDTYLPLAIDASVKVVCLGKEAEKKVKDYCTNYHVMPHPSGKNFQLNDELYVQRELKTCSEYLRSTAVVEIKGKPTRQYRR